MTFFSVVNPEYFLASATIIGTVAALLGFMLMRRKFMSEVVSGKSREEELAKRVYEAEVLREISEKIGYSLDAQKIVEIIIGSLKRLISFSTVSYLIVENNGKIKFSCDLNEAVDKAFIKDVRGHLLASFAKLTGETILDTEIEETIKGTAGDGSVKSTVASYFNLPIVVSQKVVGIINVSSTFVDIYDENTTDVLYRIARHGSQAVTRLFEIIENEKGRLSQAVESLSDGLLMVDTDFKVVLINNKLRRILNVEVEASLLDVVHALSGQLDLRTMLEAANNFEGQEIKPSEILIGDKFLQVYATKVVDQVSEKPRGVLVSFHDVSDAKSLDKLRSDFMAVMVHELRAPLTTIKSTVELINEDPGLMSPDELKHHLGVVESTSQTMLGLVNDLLDVAKMEAGKFEVVDEDADLADVIFERVEAFKPVAEAKNLKIIVDVDNDLPLAHFDKLRMVQVLNNLFSNSIKYTDDGQISVKVAKETVNGQPVDIQVSVTDSGIGIDKDDLDRLFSKFGQLKSGIKQAELKSTGLGLFIAKGIIEATGGKIWAESPGIGMGATFYFTVPLGESGVRDEQKIVFSTKKVAQA